MAVKELRRMRGGDVPRQVRPRRNMQGTPALQVITDW